MQCGRSLWVYFVTLSSQHDDVSEGNDVRSHNNSGATARPDKQPVLLLLCYMDTHVHTPGVLSGCTVVYMYTPLLPRVDTNLRSTVDTTLPLKMHYQNLIDI